MVEHIDGGEKLDLWIPMRVSLTNAVGICDQVQKGAKVPRIMSLNFALHLDPIGWVGVDFMQIGRNQAFEWIAKYDRADPIGIFKELLCLIQ
ncbi:MAG: hypothetical protein NXI27_13780 [Alphaproteobacteria bacterium]|nr:hypothetical protein [Alphaproteobacteria bacterium]